MTLRLILISLARFLTNWPSCSHAVIGPFRSNCTRLSLNSIGATKNYAQFRVSPYADTQTFYSTFRNGGRLTRIVRSARAAEAPDVTCTRWRSRTVAYYL
jgi:hypothetical protein